MAAQPRLTLMGGGAGGSSSNTGDTTYTKIFVGGLAWETQRDTMRRYFEQFGEILEAVVITDKNTGRSKGYGFVCLLSQHIFSVLNLCLQSCFLQSSYVNYGHGDCSQQFCT